MKRIIFSPLAVLFLMAACGNPNGGSDDSPSDSEASETSKPVEPDGGIGNGAGPPGDNVNAAGTALANRIPTRFHGAWDYVEGSCSLDSDMRMEISGSEIMFYESIGTVTATEAEGDDVIVTLAMEGEGETWEQQTRLSLVGEGADQRLDTSDGEAPKTGDEYPSKRCEG
jgi:hypothetical protein